MTHVRGLGPMVLVASLAAAPDPSLEVVSYVGAYASTLLDIEYPGWAARTLRR
jgi:hypothetical protein